MKYAVSLAFGIFLIAIPSRPGLFAAPLGAFELTTATPGCSRSSPQITLTWTTASGVESYDIYRNGVLYRTNVDANGRTFPDTGGNVAAGMTYTYFVRAKSGTETRDSNSLEATAPASCGEPLPPGPFTLVSATASCDGTTPEITLEWTTSEGAWFYDIYRNGVLYDAGTRPEGRSFFNRGPAVTPGATYTYFVRARNENGTTDSEPLQVTVPESCGTAPGPGPFTLMSASAGCTAGTLNVTLNWTPSADAVAYDIFRFGGLYVSDVPAASTTFIDTGVNVQAGTTYTYFIRAKNNTGTRDTGPLAATTATDCGATLTPAPFSLSNGGSLSLTSSGGTGTLTAGWGRIQPNQGNTTPAGMAIFGLRQNGVLVTEAAVPALPAMTSGRIYAEIDGAANTGVGIANPNSQAATVSFFFTDSNGNFGNGTITVPANSQTAKFLDQDPFNGRSPFSGTFTFNSTVPIAVVALRGLTNQRGEFLITTLPVTDLSLPASQNTLQFSHFADGAGWVTQVILVNPTDSVLTGTVQFRSPNGEMGNNVAYSIPARAAFKTRTSGASASLASGSVRVVPTTGGTSPSGLLIFSFQTGGITVTEASVPDVPAARAFRMYAEASDAVQTGFAVSNTSSSAAVVTLELRNLDGSSTGLTGTVNVRANGQSSFFLNQIEGFGSLLSRFKGVVRISSGSPISILGLRGRYNERWEFLIATTQPVNEAGPASTSPMLFPHFVDSGGYTTQFILFSGVAGQSPSGQLQLFSASGQSMTLPLR